MLSVYLCSQHRLFLKNELDHQMSCWVRNTITPLRFCKSWCITSDSAKFYPSALLCDVIKCTIPGHWSVWYEMRWSFLVLIFRSFERFWLLFSLSGSQGDRDWLCSKITKLFILSFGRRNPFCYCSRGRNLMRLWVKRWGGSTTKRLPGSG